MDKHKFTTIFSSSVRPLVPSEKDKYLAMASLLDIGDFIPEVDTDSQYDLLPVAFNAFVANRVNKNGDVISGPKAMEISSSFLNKPINIEHNRDRVVGVILSVGYSEFGTDQALTEDQIKDMDGPFNVTLGGVIWKVVNDSLADLIEESNDPTSEFYQKISASWELGFSDYQLAIVDGSDKNLENAEIVSNAEEIAEKEKDLKAFGGTGVLEDGRAVYRYVIGNVIPLGIGLTENPAADVIGVAVKNKKLLDKSSSNDNNNITEKSGENKTSQSDEIIVKKDVKIMKIESIKEINNESLKTLEASAVADFIEDELRKANEQYASDIEDKESQIDELKTQQEKLSTDSKKAEEELGSVKAELKSLKEEQTAKSAEEAFNLRMSQMDDQYELTDEDRGVIASDIKSLEEEDFSKYQEKLTVLLRDKNKEVLAQAKASAEAEEAKETTEVEAEATEEEVKAEEKSEEIVDEVLEEAEADVQEIPASSEAQDETLYDKYKNAFGLDQFEINKR